MMCYIQAQKATENQRAEEQLDDLRQLLKNKFIEHPSANQKTGVSVGIRLASGTKIEHTFSPIATAKVSEPQLTVVLEVKVQKHGCNQCRLNEVNMRQEINGQGSL